MFEFVHIQLDGFGSNVKGWHMICALCHLVQIWAKNTGIIFHNFKSPTSNPSSYRFYNRNISMAWELSSRNSQVLCRYSKAHDSKNLPVVATHKRRLLFVVIDKSRKFLKKSWVENSRQVSRFSTPTPLLQLNVSCCPSLALPLSASPSSQSNE